MGYSEGWNSTDQIPQRAVDSGLIGLFCAIDLTDGGQTADTVAQGTAITAWARFAFSTPMPSGFGHGCAVGGNSPSARIRGRMSSTRSLGTFRIVMFAMSTFHLGTGNTARK